MFPYDPPMIPHRDVVQVGSVVVTVDADGLRETYVIVQPAQADPRSGKVSSTSPVGRVLLGRRAGELVTIPAPGRSFNLTIESIS
jgi:transcription elongation GreA/GreB family factor